MAGYVGRLEADQTLDSPDFLKGPWRSFRRITVEPDAGHTFDGDVVEHSIFVMSGTGAAHVGSGSQPFTSGAAFTVGYGASLHLVASGAGRVELFVTTLRVPADVV